MTTARGSERAAITRSHWSAAAGRRRRQRRRGGNDREKFGDEAIIAGEEDVLLAAARVPVADRHGVMQQCPRGVQKELAEARHMVEVYILARNVMMKDFRKFEKDRCIVAIILSGYAQ